MKACDASPEALIRRGYGSTPRALIPADWETRMGPDVQWHQKRGPKPKKLTWRERRAIFEAERAQA